MEPVQIFAIVVSLAITAVGIALFVKAIRHIIAVVKLGQPTAPRTNDPKARTVTLLVRGPSLAASMSAYLIKQLEHIDNVLVRTGTEVAEACGDGHLERLVLADRNSGEFQAMAKLLNASNDDFIRTTQERHHETSRNIWNLMADSGDIYKDSYAGWYSVRDEAYYQENETELRADGVRYGPQGTPVEWVEEASYFFKLSE